MSDPARSIAEPLGADEVRIYTLDSGDSAVVRRAAVGILSLLLGVARTDIRILEGEQGKPLLGDDTGLHFSISHSRDISMVAVTGVAPVGVDVEQLRAVPNAEAILRRFFSHEELDAVLGDGQRDLRFMEAWTRGEARVKARGASIWEAAVSEPATTVRQLRAPPGFAAAVAVMATNWVISERNAAVADIVAS